MAVVWHRAYMRRRSMFSTDLSSGSRMRWSGGRVLSPSPENARRRPRPQRLAFGRQSVPGFVRL